MALIKSTENAQGIVYEYWVALAMPDILQKRTHILMCGFVSKTARDNGKSYIERKDCGFVDGVYLTGEEVYEKVKESRIDKVPIEETLSSDEVKYEEVETNFFADAKDV